MLSRCVHGLVAAHRSGAAVETAPGQAKVRNNSSIKVGQLVLLVKGTLPERYRNVPSMLPPRANHTVVVLEVIKNACCVSVLPQYSAMQVRAGLCGPGAAQTYPPSFAGLQDGTILAEQRAR